MENEIIIYQTQDGQTKIDVRIENETVWLTQNQMTELFQTTKQNISLHIKHIFEGGELLEVSTVKDYLTVQNKSSRKVSRNIKMTESKLLEKPGKISKLEAENKVLAEYAKYKETIKDELSEVEKHFLESVKKTQNNWKRKISIIN